MFRFTEVMSDLENDIRNRMGAVPFEVATAELTDDELAAPTERLERHLTTARRESVTGIEAARTAQSPAESSFISSTPPRDSLSSTASTSDHHSTRCASGGTPHPTGQPATDVDQQIPRHLGIETLARPWLASAPLPLDAPRPSRRILPGAICPVAARAGDPFPARSIIPPNPPLRTARYRHVGGASWPSKALNIAITDSGRPSNWS